MKYQKKLHFISRFTKKWHEYTILIYSVNHTFLSIKGSLRHRPFPIKYGEGPFCVFTLGIWVSEVNIFKKEVLVKHIQW